MSEGKQIQWFPGHMAKTRRIMRENLKYVDIVIEIRDARIPKSSSNPEIKSLLEKKPRIIIRELHRLLDAPDASRPQPRYSMGCHGSLLRDPPALRPLQTCFFLLTKCFLVKTSSSSLMSSSTGPVSPTSS